MLLTNNPSLNKPLFLYVALLIVADRDTLTRHHGYKDDVALLKWLEVTVDREQEALFTTDFMGRTNLEAFYLSNRFKCKVNYILYHYDIARHYLLQDYFNDSELTKALITS